jgi:hypothetical protein
MIGVLDQKRMDCLVILGILVVNKIKDGVLKALYDAVGTGTDACGIAFTLPVEQTVGLSSAEGAPAKGE